jgi:hypothetical protein
LTLLGFGEPRIAPPGAVIEHTFNYRFRSRTFTA